MEDQDWQNIINELTEQIKQISIERAVARADVFKAKNIIEALQKKIEELQADKVEDSADIQRVTPRE